MRQHSSVFCHQDPVCHGYINLALPKKCLFVFCCILLRNATWICAVRLTEQLADKVWHSRTTKAQSVLGRRGQSEATDHQRGKKKDKLLSHLSSLQFHPLFSAMAWFKATVWEWAFAAHNNVIIWFAAREWARRVVAYVPTPAMWNCCAKIHRGAVYCGTAHSSHCFCALNDRLGHNGIKMDTLCQCDMHADWKFTGPEVRTETKWK